MRESANVLKLSTFCRVHPTAVLRVAGIEPPSEHAAVTRIHTVCEECGLGWSYTVTCSPTPDHTAERYGITGRHPKLGVA